MSSQIKQCQDEGKIVTLSLGGAISQVGFSTDSQAQTFADQIWDMYLGGSGPQRPFGDAVLDGYVCGHFSFPSIFMSSLLYLLRRVDLDIESGDSTGYAAFVNRLREHAGNGTNQLYVTAAPQCPFPDAYIGQALNDAQFDAVYVQFCTFLTFLFYPPDDKSPYPRQKDNNYCGVAEPEVNFVSVSIGAFADNNVYTVTPVLQL